jgi:hypothetical protein
MAGAHYIILCVCGNTLGQCRCADPNKRIERRGPCKCPRPGSDKAVADIMKRKGESS